jgi:hypothetical protein
MTTVAQLIIDAYRESNLIPIGATPTSAEETEGLRLLNRIFFSVIGNEGGDPLDDLPIGGNNIVSPSGYPVSAWTENSQWFVPLNKRLVLNLEDARQVRLHPNPDDGARFGFKDVSNNLATYNFTVVGNGRIIAGATQQVFNTNGAGKTYFYRADLGEWKEIPTALTAVDEWFFPSEFDEMFITALAMRLNPRHGQNMTQESMSVYQRSVRQFRARYKQNVPTRSDLGLIRLTSRDSYNNENIWADPTDIFNSGLALPW